MSRRAFILPLFVLTFAAACRQTLKPSLQTPASVAIGTGAAVAAAGINRAATGECWAACRPGTECDRATGLCIEPGAKRSGASTAVRAPYTPGAAEYPPGHEFEVPPDPLTCSCPPGMSCAPDAGPIACPPD